MLETHYAKQLAQPSVVQNAIAPELSRHELLTFNNAQVPNFTKFYHELNRPIYWPAIQDFRGGVFTG